MTLMPGASSTSPDSGEPCNLTALLWRLLMMIEMLWLQMNMMLRRQTFQAIIQIPNSHFRPEQADISFNISFPSLLQVRKGRVQSQGAAVPDAAGAGHAPHDPPRGDSPRRRG